MNVFLAGAQRAGIAENYVPLPSGISEYAKKQLERMKV